MGMEIEIGTLKTYFNPDYVIGFVMSVAIARKLGCLDILA
jgi:hypothetical protein